ncbi:MAG: DUF4384 domain-containing protein [Elusimicrobia bacterium]|nr:DUF4384 domain-containing protein [Elusimicrobiota bacterium]MDE2314405.1 DUF4384 domain-containing protein [Elusimicrobiota bacterium]
MRRTIPFLFAAASAAFLAAGCAHAPAKAAPAPDYAAVQARAGAAQSALAQEMSEHGGSRAVSSAVLPPEAVPAPASVLGRDKALDCTWVESTAAVVAGDSQSRAQVRAEAISEARSLAMKSLLGVSVRSQDLVFQQEGLRGQKNLVENILRTTQSGRILKETVAGEGYQDAPGCPECRYAVDLKACIASAPSYHDADFRVTLSLARARLVDGDQDSMTVSCTEGCYVYLYDVGMDDQAQLVAPNSFAPEVKLPAGQSWTYPGKELESQGVRLVAQLPQGQSVSAETIRAVATKTPLTAAEADPSAGGYFGVLQRLDASRTDWAEDAAVFTIYQH